MEEAYTLQYRALDLIRMIYDEGNPTGVKVLMEALGLCENHLRLPLVKASDGLRLKLRNELKNTISS